jgi:hypothetical protein
MGGFQDGVEYWMRWERVAVVTDMAWIAHAVSRLFRMPLRRAVAYDVPLGCGCDGRSGGTMEIISKLHGSRLATTAPPGLMPTLLTDLPNPGSGGSES